MGLAGCLLLQAGKGNKNFAKQSVPPEVPPRLLGSNLPPLG